MRNLFRAKKPEGEGSLSIILGISQRLDRETSRIFPLARKRVRDSDRVVRIVSRAGERGGKKEKKKKEDENKARVRARREVYVRVGVERDVIEASLSK